MSSEILDLSRSPVAIPVGFHGVPYNRDRYPGAPAVQGLDGGANCQHYPYEFLRHFGFIVPDFRSSDLWEDTAYTSVAAHLQPFDLVLVNRTPRSFGGHVGVFLGDVGILHLSRAIGVPAIEKLAALTGRDAYRCFIGAKRCTRRRQP